MRIAGLLQQKGHDVAVTTLERDDATSVEVLAALAMGGTVASGVRYEAGMKAPPAGDVLIAVDPAAQRMDGWGKSSQRVLMLTSSDRSVGGPDPGRSCSADVALLWHTLDGSVTLFEGSMDDSARVDEEVAEAIVRAAEHD
jgi:hypothetical protein